MARRQFRQAPGSAAQDSGDHETEFGMAPCAIGPEDPRTATQADRRDIINEMSGNVSYWGRKAKLWIGFYWTALRVSFLFSVIAASGLIVDVGSLKLKSYAALLAAIATSFLATFNPQSQANRFADAYAYLKTAVETYKYDPRMTRCHLVRAYAKAENIVQRGLSSTSAK